MEIMKDRLIIALQEIFIERGIIGDKWKIKITDREIIGRSDWAYVYVDIYKPRCRKPCQNRKLAINFVRNIIDWDKSSFTNL